MFQLREQGKMKIGYQLVTGGEVKGFAIPEGLDLNWSRWAGNDRILVSVQTMVEIAGYEFPRSAVLVHTLADESIQWLLRDAKGRPKVADFGLEGDDVLYVAPDGSHLLLELSDNIFATPSVYHINLADGKMTKQVKGRSSVWDWYADGQGIVRAGTGWTDGKMRLFYRSSDAEDFEMVGRLDPEKEESWFSLAQIVSGTDQGYVLSDKSTGRMALYHFNYRTREIGEMAFGHDRYDIDDFDLSEDGKTLRAVWFTDDRDRVHLFDPVEKRIQSLIDRAVPHLQAWVVSRSLDQKKLLIFGAAPDNPGEWYILDWPTKQMSILAVAVQGLLPDHLARTQSVTYKARDGLEIPAYLTLPKGRSPKGLPLIIYPHGGPYGVRDKLTYDPQVQFFANRGYAVLQPNYRGSGGYGTAFSDAGIGNIGRVMQDDLDDGIDWLAGRGIADPARVCIVGGSYGGYAAQWAVIRNPERYRCGASYAGVSDWASMLRYDRRFLTKKANQNWQARIKGDGELPLDEVSPMRQSARLQRPLLLVHGKLDTNVPISQSNNFVASLPKSVKPLVKVHVYDDEGHSFSNPANFEDWLNRLDAFLAEHNPAD